MAWLVLWLVGFSLVLLAILLPSLLVQFWKWRTISRTVDKLSKLADKPKPPANEPEKEDANPKASTLSDEELIGELMKRGKLK